MPISRAAFLRSSFLLVLIGLVSLGIVVGMSVWLVYRTQSYVNEVVQVRQVRSALADLLSLLQGAETGQRGYLLTGEESYLAPLSNARSRIEPQLDLLAKLAGGSAELKSSIEQLAGLAGAKLRELSQTVDLARQGRRDEAIAIVRTDQGKVTMDQIRSLLGALVTEADARLTTSVAEQRSSAALLWWVTVLGGLMILAATAIAMWTIMLYTRELGEARREMEALNAGLEERVRERTTELSRINEEVQRFAYIVTHDLRAPLVNIMGFTAELETSLKALQAYVAQAQRAPDDTLFADAKLAADEDLPEALGFIRTSTRKMDALINAILKLSREGRRVLRPEPLDIARLIEISAGAVNHQLVEADGEISVEVKVGSVVTDRLSLEQVVGNLLDNAVKYRRPTVPLRIAVRGRREGANRIRIEVEDNGRGIAEQDLERVFELFRRSGAQDQKGEGIGLAHVRAMVRNLGGEITLSSTLGQGTLFTIVMPQDLRNVIGSIAA